MTESERLWIPRPSRPRLAASFDRPAGPLQGVVVLAHCFTCTRNYKVLSRVAAVLTRHHWGVLRFDFTGLGQSEGQFAATNLTTNILDLVDACRFAAEQLGPLALVAGHSMGGAAAILAAPQLPRLKAVAALATASRTTYLADRLGAGARQVLDRGEAEVDVYGRPFVLRRQLFEDLAGHDLEAAVRELGHRLLVVQPGADEIVSPSHAELLHRWAGERSRLVVVEGADHLFSRPDDARQAGEAMAAWAAAQA